MSLQTSSISYYWNELTLVYRWMQVTLVGTVDHTLPDTLSLAFVYHHWIGCLNLSLPPLLQLVFWLDTLEASSFVLQGFLPMMDQSS